MLIFFLFSAAVTGDTVNFISGFCNWSLYSSHNSVDEKVSVNKLKIHSIMMAY